MKQTFKVFNMQVEYQKEPLGLDVGHPRISWQLKSARRGCRQTAYQIMVGTNVGESDVWDSGKVISDCSSEVEWSGETLQICTRYYVRVCVWDQNNETAFAETEFETGLMNTSMDAWEGAEWIGAPRFTVDASTRGVFSIESEFCIKESGTAAGIVFGRNDPRLQNPAYNEYKLCGENYIAYEIDVRQIPAVLNIYRVGNEAGDSKEEPFACVPILPFHKEDRQVITETNRYEYHCLRIEVTGNCAFAYAGDTHVFCRTATYNSDTRLFYYRNLQAFRDLQENGRYPNIAPGGGSFGGITYESAPIIIVWEIYQQFGDTGVIREFYQDLKAYMEYIGNKGMPGIVFVGPLGDWLAVEETDYYLLWNAFYGHDCQLMAKLAEAIDCVEDAKHFERLTWQVHEYWNDTFVDTATGKTCDADGNLVDTQCSYALPLCYGMFNEENKKMGGRHLAKKTKDIGYIVSTGFFGAVEVNRRLRSNYNDVLATIHIPNCFSSR